MLLKMLPVYMGNILQLQMLYYAYHASSWRCHFVKKHQVNVMRMTPPFLHFFVVYTETKINCNILKNLHFEIILKNISRDSGTSGQLMVEGKP